MRVGAAWAAGLLLASGAAVACGESLGSGARRVSDAGTVLVYRSVPEPVVVGRHFTLEIALCPVAGAPAPAALRVDAHMPEHRHGMNYRPSVARRAAGRYRADGLLFHMPGRWELVFELRAASGAVQRLTETLTID